MTILFDLRAIAATCVEPANAAMLRRTADRLEVQIAALRDNPTTANMTAVNGRWALAERMIKAAKAPPQPPAPKTDVMEVEPERMAA
jgi:hypothetical protein